MWGIDRSWPSGAQRFIESLCRRLSALERSHYDLKAKYVRLQEHCRRQNKENRVLRKKLEKALRAAKRQASPFRKRPPKRNPKRSGRKTGTGHGPVNLRPRPDHVDEVYLAALPLDCPECRGDVEFDRIESQYQWDLPPDIRPVVREFKVQIGHCECCGKRLQGRHRLQTSDALGSAACQIGPNTVAMASYMNKVMGSPYEKISLFLRAFLHFDVAASTLVRALSRLAKRVEPSYDQIRALVRTSAVVYPDETGWTIRGSKAWLHAFVGVLPDGRKIAMYLIARYRGGSVAKWVLGPHFGGMMAHDGFAAYDQFEEACHQTCLNHLISRCTRLLEVATRRAVTFPRDLKVVLKHAIEVRDRHLSGKMTYHGLQVARSWLESRLDELLLMYFRDRDNRRLAKHVSNHRGQVFTFLKFPDQIEGTNCYAEQEIRPAVIARKISGCNKTWTGAHTHQVLVSYLRTAQHAGETGIEWLVDIQRQPGPRALALPVFLRGP